MTQEEVLNVIRRYPGVLFSAKQIRSILGQRQAVYVNLRKIRKHIDKGMVTGFGYKLVYIEGRGQQRTWAYYYEKVVDNDYIEIKDKEV